MDRESTGAEICRLVHLNMDVVLSRVRIQTIPEASVVMRWESLQARASFLESVPAERTLCLTAGNNWTEMYAVPMGEVSDEPVPLHT